MLKLGVIAWQDLRWRLVEPLDLDEGYLETAENEFLLISRVRLLGRINGAYGLIAVRRRRQSHSPPPRTASRAMSQASHLPRSRSAGLRLSMRSSA